MLIVIVCFGYGGNDSTLVRNYGIPKKRAKELYDKYMNGFAGMCAYQEFRRQDVMQKGYILLNKLGHRAHIYDFDSWEYLRSENPSVYRRRVAESQKQSINYPIQSCGAVMFKLASILFFKYLKEHNLLKIVKYCIPAHDNSNFCCA
jgi:DNA polymerase I-like protein with 3'-5' exonuclease and polymerase domains